MTPILRGALAASLFALSAAAAEAAVFGFRYAADEGDLVGRLTGALGPDGNTVVVTSIDQVSFGGVAMGPFTDVSVASVASTEPTVTLDGSFMNLFSQTLVQIGPNAVPDDTIILGNGALLSQFIVAVNAGALGTETTFSASRWSIAPVPLPGAFGFLAAGLAGLAVFRRRAA